MLHKIEGDKSFGDSASEESDRNSGSDHEDQENGYQKDRGSPMREGSRSSSRGSRASSKDRSRSSSPADKVVEKWPSAERSVSKEKSPNKRSRSPSESRSRRRSRSVSRSKKRSRSKSNEEPDSPKKKKSRSPTGKRRRRSRSGSRSRKRRSRSRDRKSRRSRSRSRTRRHRRSRSRSESKSGYRLHIADLDVDTSKRDLEKLFEPFGEIREIWMARSPPCFAFIVFERQKDADEAMRETHGTILRHSRIRVTEARPRARGGRSRGGYDPNLRCYQCGQVGHFSRDCTETKFGYRRPQSPSAQRIIQR